MLSYQTIYSTQIHLNSANANITLNQTKNSNCSFFLKNILKLDKSTIEMRVSLVNAQLPYSFYNINETNNQFNVSGITYNFPVGNYNVNSFISTWASVLGNNNWSITFNNITNKFNFVYTSAFYFNDGGNSMFPIMGFSLGSFLYSSNNSLLSSYPVNFSGLTRLLISSPSFGIHNITGKEEGYNNILASVPISSNMSGIINYTNITNFKNVFKNHELSCIEIIIQDDQNNFINFNNQNWSLTLQLDVVSEVVNEITGLNDVYKNAIKELNYIS